MNKVFDNLYKYSVWLVTALAIFAYFAYRVLEFDGDIKNVLTSVDAYLNLAFVIFLNLTVQSGATDSGISYGLSSAEFELAETINNNILREANGEMTSFRAFIRNLNQQELDKKRDDYLFSIGDKKVDELTRKEYRTYKKIKAIKHDISGFNLSLYYTIERGNKMSYSASFNKGEGRIKNKFVKILTGVLFGAMTINVVISASGVGSALLSILIIAFGLGLTFVMSFVPPAFKLKYDVPKRVIRKKTLWESYKSAPQEMKIIKEVVKQETFKRNWNDLLVIQT
ncbi:MAG: hypothetical protein LRY67_01830 [Gammaproteobacteria bacterium]|nr:hypothetical protein [Gammaproteobacteria bacterium]